MCHKFPTGGGTEGERSMIQVFVTENSLRNSSTSWTKNNLCWNNAPLSLENVAGTWVDRTGQAETGWDNLPVYEWDVSRSIPKMIPGENISFALYSLVCNIRLWCKQAFDGFPSTMVSINCKWI